MFVVPRVVGAVSAPTRRLSHALRGPTAPSRHITAVSVVTSPLAQSPSHELSGNKGSSPHGDKGKIALEIDDTDLN